jgi:hypothetical protein
MSRYRAQVAEVVDAVKVRSDCGYTWLGRRGRPLPADVRVTWSPAARREFVHQGLRQELYWSFYCRGAVVPPRWAERRPAAADPRLTAAISEASAAAGLEDRPDLAPGFHTIIGGPGFPEQAAVVRVYWHVTAGGAGPLVESVTTRLAGTPYRFKIANHPLRFDRCDAAVLYVSAADFPAVRDHVLASARSLASVLRRAVPAFTLALAPGVGLAEGRRAAESFGESRCALVAHGVLDAAERGEAGAAAVAARFAAAGVDPDAPYLEPSLAGRHVL